MRFGAFLMPTHAPGTPVAQGQAWDLEELERLDRLGFEEAWIGQHFTAAWEPCPAPDLLIARRCRGPAASASAPSATCCPTTIRSSWRTVPLISTTWDCLDGPGSAKSATVTYVLSGNGQGQTVIECDHDGWPDGHEALATCNTLWGMLMDRLKEFPKSGKANPAFN